ncbi:GGDEF domain-containing protein [Thalassomonas sp. M1454]|uniref:GGDEF domain-containing protein n=1 Tax=Thalassomonas sp. M1454 TaxID=2594477 RepID=UPI0011816E76|nr:GGDEF domain-containing protein [Thalassomonas sp. M1454]TRX58034.1 GGDEF domain-containing protein [Thalassomonas sp. M1454]
MLLSKIINIGCENQDLAAKNKVQTMNFITLITIFISALYTAFYYFYLQQIEVASINLLITMAYACGLIIMAVGTPTKAKLWFFIVLMLHLWICTNIYVTKDSGFHLFYFLVPTGAFLLFELHQFKHKIILSSLAIALLFYCENTINPTPLVELNSTLNNTLYQSVIFCIMVEVLIVLNLFGKQLQQHETNLKQLASVDMLTKVNSRDYFFVVSEQLFNECRNANRPFSLLIINIDNFKRINELYGYKVGDAFLQSITEKIQQQCDKSDLFGRLGGEEFVISMPEKTAFEASRLAKKITKAFKNTPVLDATDICCTASIGAIASTPNILDIHQLVACSDQALHQAKAKGLGRTEEYSEQVIGYT